MSSDDTGYLHERSPIDRPLTEGKEIANEGQSPMRLKGCKRPLFIGKKGGRVEPSPVVTVVNGAAVIER